MRSAASAFPLAGSIINRGGFLNKSGAAGSGPETRTSDCRAIPLEPWPRPRKGRGASLCPRPQGLQAAPLTRATQQQKRIVVRIDRHAAVYGFLGHGSPADLANFDTPSGSFSSNHFSAASAFANILRWSLSPTCLLVLTYTQTVIGPSSASAGYEHQEAQGHLRWQDHGRRDTRSGGRAGGRRSGFGLPRCFCLARQSFCL